MDKNHLVEEEGEGKSLNFIDRLLKRSWPRERMAVGYILASRRNRMGTYISGMQLLYA